MAGRRARLDAEIARRGLAPSRTAARSLIEAGSVTVPGIIQPKPATQVTPDQPITITEDQPRYASRGGLKLSGALDDLNVDPAGRHCMDAGAAHGGFTDVLLRRGATHVVAVDVAYGQFAWALRTDERVTLLERTNIRHLMPSDIPSPAPSLVVADLSFISLTKVLPALAAVSAPDVHMLPMVKPQFEVGAAEVGKGGVVRDPALWRRAIHDVADAAAAIGLATIGVTPSQAPGPAGNVEFFLHLVAGAGGPAAGSQPSDPAAASGVDALADEAVERGRALSDRS